MPFEVKVSIVRVEDRTSFALETTTIAEAPSAEEAEQLKEFLTNAAAWRRGLAAHTQLVASLPFPIE